jgi:hypothetical protein
VRGREAGKWYLLRYTGRKLWARSSRYYLLHSRGLGTVMEFKKGFWMLPP